MKHLGLLLGGLLLLTLPLHAQEQRLPEDYWRELLQQTRNAGVERKVDEEARLQLSRTEADTQARALADARSRLQRATTERSRLESEQEALELSLKDVQERLQRRSASLGEVFAVYRDEKSNLYGLLSDARFNHQYPDLLKAVRPDQGSERLPQISDFYRLWNTLQQSWLATGQVVSYSGDWVTPSGQVSEGRLVRLGDLQLMTNAGVLRLPQDELPYLWARQPSDLIKRNQQFIKGEGNAMLDPIRGLTLEMHSRQPSFLERVHQGGFVGYLIMGLGVAGLLIALVQSVRLLVEQRRVKRQLANMSQLSQDNTLGRVLDGMRQQPVNDVPPEALEARLDELLVRESAPLERGLAVVKLLAAIAPLLGLLGTVTGMITTFQAITLFGTGDPTVMAAGISQALVTTVQGLLTAAPLLLAHLLMQGRARDLGRILEAESSAWLAQALGGKAPHGVV